MAPPVEPPDETRSRYEAAMGKELAAAHKMLTDDVAWLRFKWLQYRTLFGTSPERVEYLREAANTFFGMMDSILFEDTLLHISRLTDPPEMGKKRNLTLLSLPALVSDRGFRARLEDLVKSAVDAAQFARDWRNRHIAHRDHHLALDDSAPPLAFASRFQVEEVLAAIEKAVASLDAHYMSVDLVFPHHGQFGDATDLLYVLRDGLRARRQREARFERGEPTDEDLHPPALD